MDNSFQSRIKQVVEKFGPTQKKFSEKIGATEASVSDYVKGKKKPNLDALQKIISVTGVNPTWLLTGEGSPQGGAGTGGLPGLSLTGTEETTVRDLLKVLRQGEETDRIRLLGTIQDVLREMGSRHEQRKAN